MSEAQPAVGGRAHERGSGLQWLGILGPPVLWKVRFWANYSLVPYACAWGWTPVMHAATVLFAAACLGCAWIGWKEWRRSGTEPEHEPGDVRDRGLFMGAFGMMSGVGFTMVILAEEVPTHFISPCL
jgi:hypothetical protein